MDQALSLLRENIEGKVSLGDEGFQLIADHVRVRQVKRKKDLLRIGEVSRFLAFVVRGCLRSYSIDDRGMEHVIQIAPENYWVSDLRSFFTGEPAELFIEATEDSTVLLLEKDDLEKLFDLVPGLDRFFRILYSKAYVATIDRLNNSLSLSAPERYQDLLRRHPDIANRVPLIHIASFLGITPESLSRIRKQLLDKK